MSKYVQLPKDAAGDPFGPGPADPGEWATLLPAIVEYLCLDAYDDGSPRRTATLLLFVQDGRWSVCLNDRDSERSAWASGPDPVQALQALDGSLQDGSASWRVSNGGNSKPRGRRSS